MSHLKVVVLDLLRVIGGEAREDQHTQDRHSEHDRRGADEDVDNRRNDQADNTHDQERTPT